MNSTALYPFYDALFHQYMYENADFGLFLTGTPLFRRIDPIQAFATIAFSPFHAAFLTAIPLHGYLPERRQNAAGRHTGYIGTGRYPGTLSSAPRSPASAVSRGASSPTLCKLLVAACRFFGWPESRSNAPF